MNLQQVAPESASELPKVGVDYEATQDFLHDSYPSRSLSSRRDSKPEGHHFIIEKGDFVRVAASNGDDQTVVLIGSRGRTARTPVPVGVFFEHFAELPPVPVPDVKEKYYSKYQLVHLSSGKVIKQQGDILYILSVDEAAGTVQIHINTNAMFYGSDSPVYGPEKLLFREFWRLFELDRRGQGSMSVKRGIQFLDPNGPEFRRSDVTEEARFKLRVAAYQAVLKDIVGE